MKKKLKGEPIPLAYYSRHNLPGAGLLKTKIVSMATGINRNFYSSLRKRGRTHYQILKMIQPERVDQFTKDVQPIYNSLDLKPTPLSSTPFWKKLIGKFKFLFTIMLLGMGLNSIGQDATPIFDGREIYADINLSKSLAGVVSIVSTHRDTLYLVNNAIGYEIEDVWCNYVGDIPVIIFKSPEWIVRENNIRKEKK